MNKRYFNIGFDGANYVVSLDNGNFFKSYTNLRSCFSACLRLKDKAFYQQNLDYVFRVNLPNRGENFFTPYIFIKTEGGVISLIWKRVINIHMVDNQAYHSFDSQNYYMGTDGREVLRKFYYLISKAGSKSVPWPRINYLGKKSKLGYRGSPHTAYYELKAFAMNFEF